MDKQPIVSILTPVYGVERYVEQCVRSLMEQSYEHCRYIFVDDCSPDKSIDIIRHVVAQYPHRASNVRIISHDHNQGVGATRNTLLDNAMGDYVIWVDSDDFVDNLLVESCVTRATITGSEMVRSSRIELVGEDVVGVNATPWFTTPQKTLRALLGQSHLMTNNIHGVLVSRELIERHKIRFAPNVDMGEDYTFLSQALYHASKIASITELHYAYRIERKGSYMYSIKQSQVESYIRANCWVSDYISKQKRAKDYEYSLCEGKMNVKKWIVKRGFLPREYDVQLFGEESERWLRYRVLRLYNQILNTKYIPLIRLFAAIITLPLLISVKSAKIKSKNEAKREKIWG